MPITLLRNTMRSRIVQELVGDRTVDIFSSLTQAEPQPQPGSGGIIPTFIQGVASIGRRLAGFVLTQAQGLLGWLLSNLWDILVGAAYEVFNFDWNQTDLEIQRQITGGNVQIAAALGNLAGSSLVWFSSVGVSAALSFKFPVLGGAIALRLAEEGGEEIRANLVGFLRTCSSVATRNVLLSSLLTARRMRIAELTPVTERRDPWTIAGAVEESVEQIQGPALRAFVENALESAVEAVIEAGYVISYVLDDYYAAARLAQQRIDGPARAVRITPDRRAEEETIVLAGPQQILMQQIPQTLATYHMLHNRDVGRIVGQPAEDWVRGGMQRRKLTIIFKSREAPPWRSPADAERTKEVTVTIPEMKAGLTWQEIKAAARRWMWGKFRATANLSGGRQMAVYGATASEAEDKLKELLNLSTLELWTLSVSEEKERNRALRKDPTMMYPAYANILVRRATTEPDGRTDLEGNNWNEELQRIDLWPTEEPPDFQIVN